MRGGKGIQKGNRRKEKVSLSLFPDADGEKVYEEEAGKNK